MSINQVRWSEMIHIRDYLKSGAEVPEWEADPNLDSMPVCQVILEMESEFVESVDDRVDWMRFTPAGALQLKRTVDICPPLQQRRYLYLLQLLEDNPSYYFTMS